MHTHFNLKTVIRHTRPLMAPSRNPVVIFSLIFLSAIWVLIFSQHRDERQKNELDLAGQAINLALTFEQHVSRTIGDLDKLMLFIRELRSSSTQSLPLALIVKSNYLINSGLANLSIADASGKVFASTFSLPSGSILSVSDRPSFRSHQRTQVDALYISTPVVGQMTKALTVQLSRPLRTPSGDFDGIILISLPVDSVTGAFKNLTLGKGGGVALVGTDDIFRAGTGAFSGRIGHGYREPETIGSVTVQRIAYVDKLNTVEKQIAEGLPRLVASRSVTNLPLQVMVSIANDDNNVTWSATTTWYVSFASLCTIALIFSSLHILRSQLQAANSLMQRNAMELEKQVAETAAIDRSLFLAVMSHEIRTPLNGVLGALDLIKSSELDDRSSRCVTMATECGETLLGLIDDVLLFSKSENSQIDLAKEPFSLAVLCDKVHTSLLSITTLANNSFTIETCPEAARLVLGDAPRLRQILVNLIGNANKFTKDGTIELRVTALSTSDRAFVARVSVTDTGIGIPKEKHALIFNRFQTLDPSYTRRTDGTGLGLAICDKLSRAMGSEIRVDSEPGRGSCFSFDLTFSYVQDEAALPPVPLQSPAAPKAAIPLRILLAEDNPTNTYVATEFLRDAGHEVCHAKNGREAVALAGTQKFDLILMDISMPEMNGIEATAAIRAQSPQNAKLPIIALTAHAVNGDREKFLKARMNGYLTKPVRKQLLLNALTSPDAIAHDSEYGRDDAASTGATIEIEIVREFVRDRSIDRALKTIKIFIAELGEKAVDLRDITERRDIGALSMLAHSLIGSGSLLGAARLVAKGRSIEADCLGGQIVDWTVAEQLAGIMDQTITEFAAIGTAAGLRALTDGPGAAGDIVVQMPKARSRAGSPDRQASAFLQQK